MNRIKQLWESRGERKLLAPFFTIGYPSVGRSIDLVTAAIESGADFVELGMPFSDPIADGPAIQFSSHRALAEGLTYDSQLSAIASIRSKTTVPVVLMGYFGPIVRRGLDPFCRDVSLAGADGLIIPDLPIEEADLLRVACEREGLSLTFLVAPTTPAPRMKAISAASSDFVYAVTVTGVTGSRGAFGAETGRYLQSVRKQVKKPFVAGFGISSGESARALAEISDGVVVGSALVDLIRTSTTTGNAIIGVKQVIREIRLAIDSIPTTN